MSNLKGKVSLLLVMILMMTAILPVFTVNAATELMTLKASKDGSNLANNTIITVNAGDTNKKIDVSVDVSSTTNLVIYYCWDKGELKVASTGSKTATVSIPNFEAGSRHILQLEAVINDNANGLVGNSNIIALGIQMGEGTTSSTTISTSLKNGSTTLSTSKNNEIAVGTNLTLKATSNKTIKAVAYKWDSEDYVQVSGSSTTIKVPTTFAAGTTHKLQVRAAAEDGTMSDLLKYTIVIPAAADIDDELIVEDWMKESSELSSLSVSLRNDSDEDKENKNIYSLGEEVIYYIDYANGTSKDIENAKLVFETELAFEVVDAFGGKVDGKKVTWEFPEGIEKDQTGTKVLVLKYTGLGKAKLTYKVINPVVDIYKGSKVIDSSAVYNLIFKDEETEISDDEHYPYMQGDANKSTFRPDDGITRAEGALVLTRIFGMSTSGTTVTNVYSDLDETYLEAQKAIVAASAAGLINGYEDGTYKPNKKMTRAEFMKIIATNIELMAEDDDIRGLEIKSSEEEIKIYKNPTKSYILGNTTVNEHWASAYVTFLARLNMTSASSKEKDLRLDEPITRAEVAQLVNFYLLRAPAEGVKKTQFTDVSKNHKLFGDIVEATRSAHTYYLTVEGTEIAADED